MAEYIFYRGRLDYRTNPPYRGMNKVRKFVRLLIQQKIKFKYEDLIDLNKADFSKTPVVKITF